MRCRCCGNATNQPYGNDRQQSNKLHCYEDGVEVWGKDCLVSLKPRHFQQIPRSRPQLFMLRTFLLSREFLPNPQELMCRAQSTTDGAQNMNHLGGARTNLARLPMHAAGEKCRPNPLHVYPGFSLVPKLQRINRAHDPSAVDVQKQICSFSWRK